MMKDQINKIMETEGMTPAKFADEIGVQRSSISHIISGRNKPSYDFIIKILARFSGINAEWLLTGKGNMIKTSGTSSDTGNFKQSTLFDQPKREVMNKQNIQDKKIRMEDTEVPYISDEKKYVNETDDKKLNEQKTNQVRQFTNVNSAKYILIFYEDGKFEQFMPR
jgi:transcriptional regulator with XRE-family HTH domain